jgi:hypothetical protein
MSSYWKKVDYVIGEDQVGVPSKMTLYIENDITSDTVLFYNQNGCLIFSYNECGTGDQLDLGQAIVKSIEDDSDLPFPTVEEKERLLLQIKERDKEEAERFGYKNRIKQLEAELATFKQNT